LAIAVVAAGACGTGPDLETRTFTLKYMNAGMAAQILEPYVFDDRERAPGKLSWANNIITVRETRDNLDRIARILAELDQPRPSVRLRFQIIQADGVTRQDPAIAEIEETLRKLFRFEGYRLLADAVMAGTEGAVLNQDVSGGGHVFRVGAEIQEIRAVGDSGAVRIAVSLEMRGGALRTTITIPVGEIAVLGNAQVGTNGGQVVLAVRPELVAGH
jgi:hypothetical protein